LSSKFLPSLIAFTFVAIALPVAAQVAVTQPKQPCKCTQQKPQPYTAEFKITHVQTLNNGATITHESTEIVAHDSAGRHMSSTTQVTQDFNNAPQTYGNVNDPVERTNANWDSNSRKATIIQYPPADQQHGCWASQSGAMRVMYDPMPASAQQAQARAQITRPASKTEDLGTTTIQGVEATGRRTTTTIAAGQMGNDQPIMTTDESWWATGTGLQLRSVHDDPRSGTTTREVTSLSLGEPDSTLFQPPDGYEAKVDELHQVACAQ
jgi:hypothetical protein